MSAVYTVLLWCATLCNRVSQRLCESPLEGSPELRAGSRRAARAYALVRVALVDQQPLLVVVRLEDELEHAVEHDGRISFSYLIHLLLTYSFHIGSNRVTLLR